uniref:Uncharacterized protein n=2 Tax=Picea TaxID=3328 RepID=A0A101LWE4_PICGL|nr:hypothetical protein ABT39_MTgene1492 [Picea glauca]QHR92659.1 hypothetical protein Q903MT_gene6707 [Picea sitchensis]
MFLLLPNRKTNTLCLTLVSSKGGMLVRLVRAVYNHTFFPVQGGILFMEKKGVGSSGGLAKHHIQTGRVLLFFPVSDDLGEGNYLPRARASGRENEWIAS